MFDRLLIPLDGTSTANAALDAAERLADRWDASMTVTTLLRRGDRYLGLDGAVRRQTDRMHRKRDVEVRSLSYSVGEDIAGSFDAVPNTLIVMSTWARGRSAGLATNVAEDVLRHVRQPILLMGPADEIGDDWPSGKLLVCVDGTEFADTVVPFAAQWAKDLRLEPLVVGVIDTSKVPATIPRVAESNAVAQTARAIEDIVGRGPVGYDTLHGRDPARAIVDHAERNDVAMIALATHGRTGLSRLLHGSVAMDVIRAASCPVLVERPPIDPNR